MVKNRYLPSVTPWPLLKASLITVLLLVQVLGRGLPGPDRAWAGLFPGFDPAALPAAQILNPVDSSLGGEGRPRAGKRFRLGAGFGARAGRESLLDLEAGLFPDLVPPGGPVPRADEGGQGALGSSGPILPAGGDLGGWSGAGDEPTREESLRSSLHRRLRLKFSPLEKPEAEEADRAPEIRSWLGGGPAVPAAEIRPSSLWLGLWLDLGNDLPGRGGWARIADRGPEPAYLPAGWPAEPGIGLTGQAGQVSFQTALSLDLRSSGQTGQGPAIFPAQTGLAPDEGGRGTVFEGASPPGTGELELAGLATYGQVSWAGFSLGGGFRISAWNQEAWSQGYDRSQAWSMLIFAAYEVILGKVVIRPEVVWLESALPAGRADPGNSVGMGLFTRLAW